MTHLKSLMTTILVFVVSTAIHAEPLGTGFTYQGELLQLATPANGIFDFKFELFDVASDGSPVSETLQLEDVTVSGGVFTVELDFGALPFTGAKLWLEIGVRVGASVAVHTLLAPRQELTAAPFALQASSVSAGSITMESIQMGSVGSTEIANLSIMTIDIANSTITQAKLAPNSVGSPEIINGAVTQADHAPASVGSTEIIESQVQRRITGTCDPGSVMAGVNVDGSAVCVFLHTVVTTVDDAVNDVGEHTSIAMGTDGFPVISYRDRTAHVLKVAKCNDTACAGNDETITTVDDPDNEVGDLSSIAIGNDGFPVISYRDTTAGALKVTKCNDAACAGNDETITTVDDPDNQVGDFSSLAIGNDGFPVISYYDSTAGALKVAKCNDAACAGNDETITTVDDTAGFEGEDSSIAIGTDGFPVISYHDETAGALKVAKCNDAACAGNDETITIVDDETANDEGRWTSIAIGTDGFPVISYIDNTLDALKVAKCNDAACAGNDETITTVADSASGGSRGNSIAIGTDGFPVICYFDQAAGVLKVVKCNDTACADGDDPITTVDHTANLVGRDCSIAIGADGLPVISYHDSTAGTLKVAHCATPSCQ